MVFASTAVLRQPSSLLALPCHQRSCSQQTFARSTERRPGKLKLFPQGESCASGVVGRLRSSTARLTLDLSLVPPRFCMWLWHDEGAHPRTLPTVIKSRLLGLSLAAFTATAAPRPTVPAARFSCHQRPVILVSIAKFCFPTRARTTHPPLFTKTFELQAPIASHGCQRHPTIPADHTIIG